MILEYGMTGKNVRKLKDALRDLGYLLSSTHDYFGLDTQKALREFQQDHGLNVTGAANDETFKILMSEWEKLKKPGGENNNDEKYLDFNALSNIPRNVLISINSALAGVSDLRKKIVADGLMWVFPHGLYVFGANLYTNKLEIQKPTPAYIDRMAAMNPGYFNGGRKEWMKLQYNNAVKSGERIACADCSGQEVGLWRKFGVVKSGFDSTARGIYSSYCTDIKKNRLTPGDCLFKKSSSGNIPHMAMYIGAGYVLEAVGGAFGIQVTELDNHVVYNHMTNRKELHPPFNLFGRPKFLQ